MADYSFTAALQSLGADAAFRVMNERRPPAAYLLAQILPERNSFDYAVSSGTMTVKATMAGLVGMDSPYPEGGVIAASTFSEQSAKMALSMDLPERAIRALQQMVMRLNLTGGNVPEALAREVLNFVDKLLLQAHFDATEWLRGQALSTGALAWTFNQKTLAVNYGIPAGNFLASRTGTAGYGGTASTFWDDIKAARRLLKGNVRAFIAHPDMIDAIIYNSANTANVLQQDGGGVTIQRYRGTLERPSTDARETVTLISYGLEGEVLDPANQGVTVVKPFIPNTKLIAIGNNTGTEYVVGAGGNAPVDNALGYTHIAPTVEGGGQPGRWARVYVPEHRPYALRADSVANLLPVIEAPEKIVIMSSVLP